MKKFISNILSLLLVVALFGTNIVSANYLRIKKDGVIIVNLTKNNELSAKTFVENPNGYITKNKINSLNLIIDNSDKILKIDGDLKLSISGNVSKIETKNSIGYESVFQGMVDEDTPIIAALIYD